MESIMTENVPRSLADDATVDNMYKAVPQQTRVVMSIAK